MEKKRFNLNNQRLQKILKKLRKSDSTNNIRNKNKNNSNKSYDNNFTTNIQNNMTLSNKNTNTMDSYGYTYEKSDKLPLIENTPKYKIVKMIKEKNEEEFCAYTLQKIKENEKCHRINYLKQINSINNNILKKNKLYRQRSMHCLISAKNKYEKLKEEYNALVLEQNNLQELYDKSLKNNNNSLNMSQSIISNIYQLSQEEYEEYDILRKNKDENEALILQLKSNNQAKELEKQELKAILRDLEKD
jgi:hypothetical protein